MATTNTNLIPSANTVYGTVTSTAGRPLGNLKIEIYDVDMREWQALANTITGKDGKYELRWTADQLKGRDLGTADIGVKVFTREGGSLLYSSTMDDVRFNAGSVEVMDVTISIVIPAERIEFDYLAKRVGYLAGEVAIADLQENKDHQDITFLSREMDEPEEKVVHLVVAHRLERLSKAGAAFFYALLRENTLLRNDFSKNLSARNAIGMDADIQVLLYDVALTDRKAIETDVNKAVEEKIVDPFVIREASGYMDEIGKYKDDAGKYYKGEHLQKAIGLVASVFQKGKLDELQQIFQANKDDLNVFFDKVTDPGLFDSKGNGTGESAGTTLGNMSGLGAEVVSRILKGKGIEDPQDVRKLAKLNKAGWVKEINDAKQIETDPKIISTYASAIVRRFEKEFPTLAFAAQLEREDKQVLNNQKEIISFLNADDRFDMVKDNIDRYIKDKKVNEADAGAIREELKSVQRIFKLVPHYGKTLALRKENVSSAQSIVAMGQTRFVNEVAPKANLSATEAKDIYNKAAAKHTAAMLVAGELQDTMSVMDIASFETTELAKKLDSVSKDFPNLKSLFKGIDTCACEECRSVYSPAAYLVEILEFLDKRTVKAGNARSVLLDRRPELGEIDLGCANANTPVKYIDLVCELLEEAISPDQGIDFTGDLSTAPDPLKGKISNGLFNTLIAAGLPVTSDAVIYETESDALASSLPHYLRDTKLVCKIVNIAANNYKVYRLRQTLSSAEELDAAPEYVNTKAYDELKKKAFAFTLPFDLDHTEAHSYFNRFDVGRADLMRAFQAAGNPADEAIAAESLGLTNAERIIIAAPPVPNDNAAQQAFWNVPAPGVVVDYLKQVDHFLDRTGLSYTDLDLLLKLKFIDTDGSLFIQHQDLTCDTSTKIISNFSLDVLDRIHRFLRLQKKTGWKFEVLDAIISQAGLGNGSLDNPCLVKAAQLSQIAGKTGIKIDELVGCFGDIPNAILQEDAPKPLYYQVFLNKAKNGVVDEGLLPEKVDGSQVITTYTGVIATCLQMKQKDLEVLLPLLADNKLDFKNLSYLFAASRFIRKLKLKVDDFSVITTLTGIDISASPSDALTFIKYTEGFTSSPLKTADVLFILDHEATNLADRVIGDTKVQGLLTTLKDAYGKVNDLYKSKFDVNLTAVEQTDTLINILSALVGVTEDDVKVIIKFLDRDWVSAAAAKTYIDDRFDKGIARAAIDVAIDALNAAAGPDLSPEQKGVVKAFMDAVAAFEIVANKDAALQQVLATAFKLEPDMVVAVLSNGLLKQPAPGTDLLSDLLSDNFTNAINELNYPRQYAAVRLLHKMAFLISALGLDAVSVTWYLKNNKDLTWFEPDGMPYDAVTAATDFKKYLAFVKILSYSKDLTAVINPADAANPVSFFSVAEMLLTTSTAVRNDLLQAMSILTGYEMADLDAADALLFAVFNRNNYRDIDNWDKLLRCVELMSTLGATASQVVGYIKPVLVAADVNDLRATLKARYDEDTWLGTLKEIMDAIRPQKRDALVAYLLATNPGIKDEDDLYEYFLVDVEMCACMPSSRIVQAHNSIQLFVQRCLMGLEPDAMADVDGDPNWNQWKWMKNYRVWEANRKVFLYPENWYDVALSNDMTFQLTEFINEIQQNELTNDTAEEALKKYLEKLDNIAFLEVMATWYDVPNKDMHVFARTKGGDPSIYYYRRFEQERYWSPWEKVDLDITGDHLLAFIRNNRLNLAWPVFTEEAQPDQKSKVPAASDQGNSVDPDRPKKKLKIQLAISEYNNKKWQPKRISKEGIHTPNTYTDNANDLDRDIFNMLYFEAGGQVWFFTEGNQEDIFIGGIFNIAGCKGYPELLREGKISFPDFFPDFKDTELLDQRYNEIVDIPPDDLSVRNGLSIFTFYQLLGKTPGKFRITYPHQFTKIDLIALIYQFFIMLLFGNKLNDRRKGFKIPLGTLLPYFQEDSNHAYVIVPGYYKKTDNNQGVTLFTDEEKRTASDVFQLMADIADWIKRMLKEFTDNPPADINEVIQRIITDAGFQDILTELSNYEKLDFIFDLLIGTTGSEEFDTFLKGLKSKKGLEYGEEYKNMYHPMVCPLRATLYKDGIPALMKRDTQLNKTTFNFETWYQPNADIIPKMLIKNPDGTTTPSWPIEDVDFTSDGSYSAYNWDLFFRVPLHIATSLTANQRFEDALTWFHYMFNPTGALPGTGVQKYWVTKPFYLNQDADYIAQRIDALMYAVSDSSNPQIKELENAIAQWRNNPFMPDVVARFRPVAYQKALLMKYIDNLTAWGDYLFRQDTMESVAQATQMYILADKLLGPKPRIIPPLVKAPYETYNQIKGKLDSFGNALIELENILPDISALPEGGAELPAPPVTLAMLYFCIPPNENMAAYWDLVADRLFKIRHCQNADGIERSLALFAPPIDPGLLVKAAASGLDLSAVLAGLNAPTPYYRFTTLSQKATELIQELRSLGGSLLQTLEKKDAEALSLLRNELEIKLLNATRDIKKFQIEEAKGQIEVLQKTKLVTEERHNYYASIQKITSKEQLNLDKLDEANGFQVASQIVRTIAGALRLIPEFHVGASGFGGSPEVVLQLGGSALSTSTSIGADILNILSTVASFEANRASIMAGHDRRFDDWKLQERLAQKELDSIDKQLAAADIRRQIAETDLRNHDIQIDNSKKTDEFMRSKFTNKELYDWIVGQISAVYFSSYQMAHDFAKKAERCYRFELGNDDTYISYGYWDSMKKGLQSADHLLHDLKRMETGYLDKNKRDYEITKHVSLAMLDPIALVRLRATGACDFEIPEALYDMDYAGQYFRRIKSVSMSLPCIAGPYTSVGAKLSLVKNKYRKNTNPNNLAGTGYVEDLDNDERFVYNVGAIQSIATSHAQNDSGMFELNFKDDRYLPFENTGAISSWRLELPTELQQFDYNTISDVIIHVKYTAREGGSGIKSIANAALSTQLGAIQQELSQTGMHIYLNMKHDLPNEWYLLKKNGTIDLTIDKSRLPYMVQALTTTAIEDVMFVAKVKNNPANFNINIDGAADTGLSRVDAWELCRGINSAIDLDTQFVLSVPAQLDTLEDLALLVKFSW